MSLTSPDVRVSSPTARALPWPILDVPVVQACPGALGPCVSDLLMSLAPLGPFVRTYLTTRSPSLTLVP